MRTVKGFISYSCLRQIRKTDFLSVTAVSDGSIMIIDPAPVIHLRKDPVISVPDTGFQQGSGNDYHLRICLFKLNKHLCICVGKLLQRNGITEIIEAYIVGDKLPLS